MHRGLSSLFLLVMAFASVPGAAQDGQAKAAPCGACHGLTGNSITPLWPSLAGQHAAYTIEQLKAYKEQRRSDPQMNAMVITLTDQDIQDIADFYAAQEPSIGSINIDQVATGALIYRGGNSDTGVPACMACHGPDGAGNALAGYPAVRGQLADYTVKQLEDYRDNLRTTDPNSMMRMISVKLTIEEMTAVAAYMSALH